METLEPKNFNFSNVRYFSAIYFSLKPIYIVCAIVILACFHIFIVRINFKQLFKWQSYLNKKETPIFVI